MSEVQESLEPASPEPEAHSSPRLGTEYVILSLEQDVPGDGIVGQVWRVQVESITASSQDAAIRLYCEEGKQEGTFEAVPVRSWQPREVKAEVTTTMRLV